MKTAQKVSTEKFSTHFQKHQSISFVLPVMNPDNTISIKVFPNDDADTTALGNIANEINGEYQAVAEVLNDFPVVRAEVS